MQGKSTHDWQIRLTAEKRVWRLIVFGWHWKELRDARFCANLFFFEHMKALPAGDTPQYRYCSSGNSRKHGPSS